MNAYLAPKGVTKRKVLRISFVPLDYGGLETHENTRMCVRVLLERDQGELGLGRSQGLRRLG